MNRVRLLITGMAFLLAAPCVKAGEIDEFEERFASFKQFIEHISKNKNLTSPDMRSIVEAKLLKLKSLASQLEAAAVQKGFKDAGLRAGVMTIEKSYGDELLRANRGGKKSPPPVTSSGKKQTKDRHKIPRSGMEGWSVKFYDTYLAASDNVEMALEDLKEKLADTEGEGPVPQRAKANTGTPVAKGGGR